MPRYKTPTRGRRSGSKNLVKTDGGLLVNQHGVTFTPEQKKALTNAVNAVNAKRRKLMKDTETAPLTMGGQEIGGTVKDLRLMGREENFLMSKQSKSMQRFTSMEQYNKYMEKLQGMKSPDYLVDKARAYKRNYLKAFDEAYGDADPGLRMKIQMMKPLDFVKLAERDNAMEISYQYTETDQQRGLTNIRLAMGMEPLDDYDFYDGDDY